MKIEELEKRLLAVVDASQAQPMKAYMKNHFDFLGVRTPDRRKVARQFFKESKAQGID